MSLPAPLAHFVRTATAVEDSVSPRLLPMMDVQTPNVRIHAGKRSISIQQLTDQAWHVPYSTVEWIQSLTFGTFELTVTTCLKDPTWPSSSPSSLTEADVAEIRAVALAEPSLLRLMVSRRWPCGRPLFVNAHFPSPARTLNTCRRS